MIHQAEVDYIDRNLRVIACFQFPPDHLFQRSFDCGFGAVWWRNDLFSECVGVEVVNANCVSRFGHHGVGAAEFLDDPDLSVCSKDHRLSTGNDIYLAVPAERDPFVDSHQCASAFLTCISGMTSENVLPQMQLCSARGLRNMYSFPWGPCLTPS